MNKYDILKNIFGYTSFRPGQEKVIDAILSGMDVLAVMPTGAGKSLCYQISDRRYPFRHGCACGNANRSREVALLSNPGFAFARNDRGYFSAYFADERSSERFNGSRLPGSLS